MSNTRLVYNRVDNAESCDWLFTSPLAGGGTYCGGPTIQAAQPVMRRLVTAKDRASAFVSRNLWLGQEVWSTVYECFRVIYSFISSLNVGVLWSRT